LLLYVVITKAERQGVRKIVLAITKITSGALMYKTARKLFDYYHEDNNNYH